MSAITDLAPRKPKQSKPAHWADNEPSRFVNPWASWHEYPASERIIPFMAFNVMNPTYPKPDKVDLPNVQSPKWDEYRREEMKGNIKSTWLGHASFLLELPAKPSEPRGVRILFDPVFSKRCSSVQFVGPKRYTSAPCKIEEILDIDVVVISHNHYDHMDANTLRDIFKRPRKPHVFAPLGNGDFLISLGIPDSNVHIMDWWESKHVEIPASHLTSQATAPVFVTLSFDITCTPCQHFTGRMLFDDYKTLWCSWVVQSPPSASASHLNENEMNPRPVNTGNGIDSANVTCEGVKVFFAGDTGYRSVPDGKDEDTVPRCPAFKEIGDEFGGFDFAMIPIGAYLPRRVMSPIHCAPQDSVCLFKDIKARKALGMHWGTWILTTEAVDEPPKKLAEECKKAGIPDGAFSVCDIGETMFW